jgi:hypothetical protein
MPHVKEPILKTEDPKPVKKSKILYNGPAKYTAPNMEGKKPPKLTDYSKIGPPDRKPNRVKLKIDFDDNRFPPESLVQNFRKYDSKGNYKRKYEPKIKESTDMKAGGGAYSIMKSMSLSNPSRSSGRAPKARKR